MRGRKRKSSEMSQDEPKKAVLAFEEVKKEDLIELNVNDFDLNEANLEKIWEKFDLFLAEEALQLLVAGTEGGKWPFLTYFYRLRQRRSTSPHQSCCCSCREKVQLPAATIATINGLCSYSSYDHSGPLFKSIVILIANIIATP